jgi:hypothetical protein
VLGDAICGIGGEREGVARRRIEEGGIGGLCAETEDEVEASLTPSYGGGGWGPAGAVRGARGAQREGGAWPALCTYKAAVGRGRAARDHGK